MADTEILSDHCYVFFIIRNDISRANGRTPTPNRWALNKMDRTMFRAALEWSCSVGPSEEDLASAASLENWIRRVMIEACDASAPRIGKRNPRRRVYWWNSTIAELRGNCTRARRAWTRSRRGSNLEVTNRNRALYKQAKKELCLEITRVKSAA